MSRERPPLGSRARVPRGVVICRDVRFQTKPQGSAPDFRPVWHKPWKSAAHFLSSRPFDFSLEGYSPIEPIRSGRQTSALSIRMRSAARFARISSKSRSRRSDSRFAPRLANLGKPHRETFWFSSVSSFSRKCFEQPCMTGLCDKALCLRALSGPVRHAMQMQETAFRSTGSSVVGRGALRFETMEKDRV